ncbi:ATP-binding cassette domain-containing protein [Duganella sp. FT80W]|uniref:ATP-binding cassette domain-containing protein n=1 Tax=Duganella guangzhouensis TaxID=2666084 RepID=A0A6I2L585_9BURK|nr:ABC transporter ATP-binding protein [Duganella guangzhouensis]MRW93308.1 ATP-binding cassette domain-containing protein [Duganella guangzhouensis]
MLCLRNLHKTYANGVHATRDISLEIPTGLFGLLGPNGAGKSSLMRTIATLQRPDSGSIHLDGIDVLAQPLAMRRQLGYLPQDFGVYPKVSALELLNHFAILKGITARGERREMVEALLQQTNLWEVRRRAVHSYSGGMRQRFGIAQALLGAPRLVIADEPTAGLDPDERNRFLNLLARIGEQVVVILSTHIVADVTDLCQRMAIIAAGRVVASGEPQVAIAALQASIWQRSISESMLDDYQQRYTVLSSRLQGGKPHIRVHATEAPGDGFVPCPPSLEDLYFLTLRGAR